MQNEKDVRLDKWLWAVRIYKTRSQASEACRKGRVLISGQPAKASRILRKDETVQVKKPPVLYSYQVKGLLGKRLSASAVKDYVENTTTDEELDKLRVKETFFIVRDRGSGRPTKKERRTIDKLRRE